MKNKIWLKVSKHGNDLRVTAHNKIPNNEPLRIGKTWKHKSGKALPTVCFSIELDISNEMFNIVKAQLETKINVASSCIGIKQGDINPMSAIQVAEGENKKDEITKK